MKKFLFLLAFVAAFSSVTKADIEFNHSPWQEILAQAGKENKLVFMDAYTTWCGPCKWMAANTFTNPEVADFFNKHFINAKIDMEKGEGVDLAIKYNVRAYPTLLFVSASGDLFHVAIGALNPEQFLALGKQVTDPKFVSISAAKAKYEANKDDRSAQAEYIVKMTAIGQDVNDVLEAFKPGMSGAALLQPENWNVFQAVLNDLESDEAKYFLGHRAEFVARYGATDVDQKLMEMYLSAMGQATYAREESDYMSARASFLKSGHPEAKKMVLFQDLGWYESAEDWGKYVSTAHEAVKMTPDLAPNALNSLAWTFYLGVSKKKDLEAALGWADRACKAEPIYAFLDTKAMLLKKLGRKDEAIKVAREAIEVAKRDKEPYGDTEAALNEMLGK